MAPRLSPGEALARGFIDSHEEKSLPQEDRKPSLPKDAANMLKAEAKAAATPFGRPHFETRCGFKVQGIDLVESFHPSGRTGLDGPDSAWVDPAEPMSVVLRFANGCGVIMPAIPDFVTGLTFEDGNLINVVYEPADTSLRWNEYHHEIARLRKLRGKIAAATRFGIFQPIGEGIEELARQMQVSKGFDPTMALYAAYAYHAIQQSERIKEMERYLLRDLGIRFFDLSLLAGTINDQWPVRVVPSTPLLAQGWALLSARRVILPPGLARLQACLTSSLWSTFKPEGVDLLKTALRTGEIPL
jgi:hypothetical protein